jgi:hypothetical protein
MRNARTNAWLLSMGLAHRPGRNRASAAGTGRAVGTAGQNRVPASQGSHQR